MHNVNLREKIQNWLDDLTKSRENMRITAPLLHLSHKYKRFFIFPHTDHMFVSRVISHILLTVVLLMTFFTPVNRIKDLFLALFMLGIVEAFMAILPRLPQRTPVRLQYRPYKAIIHNAPCSFAPSFATPTC
jgi:hypothetical protein